LRTFNVKMAEAAGDGLTSPRMRGGVASTSLLKLHHFRYFVLTARAFISALVMAWAVRKDTHQQHASPTPWTRRRRHQHGRKFTMVRGHFTLPQSWPQHVKAALFVWLLLGAEILYCYRCLIARK
jgi:hypothetical protein